MNSESSFTSASRVNPNKLYVLKDQSIPDIGTTLPIIHPENTNHAKIKETGFCSGIHTVSNWHSTEHEMPPPNKKLANEIMPSKFLRIYEWTPFLNEKLQLCIRGYSFNLKEYKTSGPILKRISKKQIRDDTQLICLGNANFDNTNYSSFIKLAFQNGFPENWQQVTEAWIQEKHRACSMDRSARVSRANLNEKFILDEDEQNRKRFNLPEDYTMPEHKRLRVDDVPYTKLFNDLTKELSKHLLHDISFQLQQFTDEFKADFNIVAKGFENLKENFKILTARVEMAAKCKHDDEIEAKTTTKNQEMSESLDILGIPKTNVLQTFNNTLKHRSELKAVRSKFEVNKKYDKSGTIDNEMNKENLNTFSITNGRRRLKNKSKEEIYPINQKKQSKFDLKNYNPVCLSTEKGFLDGQVIDIDTQMQKPVQNEEINHNLPRAHTVTMATQTSLVEAVSNMVTKAPLESNGNPPNRRPSRHKQIEVNEKTQLSPPIEIPNPVAMGIQTVLVLEDKIYTQTTASATSESLEKTSPLNCLPKQQNQENQTLKLTTDDINPPTTATVALQTTLDYQDDASYIKSYRGSNNFYSSLYTPKSQQKKPKFTTEEFIKNQLRRKALLAKEKKRLENNSNANTENIQKTCTIPINTDSETDDDDEQTPKESQAKVQTVDSPKLSGAKPLSDNNSECNIALNSKYKFDGKGSTNTVGNYANLEQDLLRSKRNSTPIKAINESTNQKTTGKENVTQRTKGLESDSEWDAYFARVNKTGSSFRIDKKRIEEWKRKSVFRKTKGNNIENPRKVLTKNKEEVSSAPSNTKRGRISVKPVNYWSTAFTQDSKTKEKGALSECNSKITEVSTKITLQCRSQDEDDYKSISMKSSVYTDLF